MGRWGHDHDDDPEDDGKSIYRPRYEEPTKKPIPRRRVRLDDDSPKRRTPRPHHQRGSLERKPTGSEIKTEIKRLIYDRPRITVSELQMKMQSLGIKMSIVLISNIRAEYRHTIRFLIAQGATGLDGQVR